MAGQIGDPVGDRARAATGAQRCWQAMTALNIDNQADAIDYLRSAPNLPRLSARDLRALVLAFPPIAREKIPQEKTSMGGVGGYRTGLGRDPGALG